MTNEEIIKEVILSFREKCRLGEPIGRWEKEMEFTVKLTLALQKKELLEKVEKMKETPANRGMFMWVQGYNQAIKALKKQLK